MKATGIVLASWWALALSACGGARPASIGPSAVDIPVRGATPAPVVNDGSAREQPPPPVAAKESPFPALRRTELANGLDVAIAEAHALPLVQVRVIVRAGNGYGGTPGAAELTAQLLKDGGTRTMKSAELLDRIESLGANLSIDVDMDSSRLGLAIPKDKLDAALSILAEVVTEPAFDERELGKLKGRERDEAKDAARSNGTWMATRALFHELYAQANPYATYDLLPSEIARINLLTVRDFHRKFYVPKNASVILVGDLDGAAASKAVDKAFGTWKGGEPPKQEFPEAIPLARRRVILANRPKSAQSDIFIVSLVPPRKSADWPALRVANHVLGGVPAGRLFLDVREQRSLAYSAQSRVIELAHGDQPLAVYVGTQTPKTGAAVQGAIEDMERMTTSPPTSTETESARRYLSDVFAIRMETIGSIADMIAQQVVFGLPEDYWDVYRAALRATDATQAAASAAKTFHPDQALLVVAGDADVIAPVLSRFGEVTVVDPEHEFQAVRTLAMDPNAPLEAPPK
jgi:predicted Zn-dependent peptidase